MFAHGVAGATVQLVLDGAELGCDDAAQELGVVDTGLRQYEGAAVWPPQPVLREALLRDCGGVLGLPQAGHAGRFGRGRRRDELGMHSHALVAAEKNQFCKLQISNCKMKNRRVIGA